MPRANRTYLFKVHRARKSCRSGVETFRPSGVYIPGGSERALAWPLTPLWAYHRFVPASSEPTISPLIRYPYTTKIEPSHTVTRQGA